MLEPAEPESPEITRILGLERWPFWANSLPRHGGWADQRTRLSTWLPPPETLNHRNRVAQAPHLGPVSNHQTREGHLGLSP